jgi:hypothetical protein
MYGSSYMFYDYIVIFRGRPSAFWEMLNWGLDVVHVHHVARHNTPIHNILSTTPQLALGMFPEDGNVMSKHVGDTIHN